MRKVQWALTIIVVVSSILYYEKPIPIPRSREGVQRAMKALSKNKAFMRAHAIVKRSKGIEYARISSCSSGDTIKSVASGNKDGVHAVIIGCGPTNAAQKISHAVLISYEEINKLTGWEQLNFWATTGAYFLIKAVERAPSPQNVERLENYIRGRFRDLAKAYPIEYEKGVTLQRNIAFEPGIAKKLATSYARYIRIPEVYKEDVLKSALNIAKLQDRSLHMLMRKKDLKNLYKKACGTVFCKRMNLMANFVDVLAKGIIVTKDWTGYLNASPSPWANQRNKAISFIWQYAGGILSAVLVLLLVLQYFPTKKGEEKKKEENLEEGLSKSMKTLLKKQEFLEQEEIDYLKTWQTKVFSVTEEEKESCAAKIEEISKNASRRKSIQQQEAAEQRKAESLKPQNTSQQETPEEIQKRKDTLRAQIPGWAKKVEAALAACKDPELKEKIEGDYAKLIKSLPTSSRPQKDLNALQRLHTKLQNH